MYCDMGCRIRFVPSCPARLIKQLGYYYVEDDDVQTLSPEQRSLIDREVKGLIDRSTQRVRNLLDKHRAELEMIKEALLEYETITGEELKKVIKGEKIRRGEAVA
jgi:cell division protease FtsH